jgi:glucans biosynthesis protein C
VTAQLVRMANFRGGLFLLATPLLISQLALRPLFPAYQDWADIATYLFVFAMGAILFSNRGFEGAIRRDIGLILGTGVLSTLGTGVMLASIQYNFLALPRQVPVEQLAFACFWSFNVWAWNLAVLYVGIRWLNAPNRVLDYAKESVLPFYVIHHPVVITLASFIVTWPLAVAPKFLVLALLSYAITLGIYETCVRRWAFMRALFGLGPAPRRMVETKQAMSPA